MSVMRPLINALAALANVRAAPGAMAAGGIEGEILISPLRGKYSARAKSGKLFIASTLLAGVTIPVNAASLVSVFTLYNPVGSGVDLELGRLQLSPSGTTTAVIGDLALAFQNTAATTALASLTAGPTPQCGYIGQGTSKALFYTAATYTGTPTILDTLGVGFGTTADAPGPNTNIVDFDGAIIVPPGYSVTVVGNVAQTQPLGLSLTYSEVPV